MKQMACHANGELRAEPLGHQVQHHVEGRGPGRARDPVAVDLEEVVRDQNARVVLGEALDNVVVRGRAITLEQLRPGQDDRTGIYRADALALAVHLSQPGKKNGGRHRHRDASWRRRTRYRSCCTRGSSHRLPTRCCCWHGPSCRRPNRAATDKARCRSASWRRASARWPTSAPSC